MLFHEGKKGIPAFFISLEITSELFICFQHNRWHLAEHMLWQFLIFFSLGAGRRTEENGEVRESRTKLG